MIKENKKLLVYILLLFVFKVSLYLLAADRYGLGRDEYYFVACAKRLSFGYIDHPPLIAFLARMALFAKEHTAFLLRMGSAFAGGITLMLVAFLTHILGGKRKAVVLSAVVYLAAPVFLRMHTKFSISVFENLLMLMSFCVLGLIIKFRKPQLLVLFFTIAGIAFLLKYSIVFWLGMFVLLICLLNDYRFMVKSRYFYWGAGCFLLLICPNVFWQYSHGFPIVESFKNINAHHVKTISYLSFAAGQVFYLHPIGFAFSVLGVLYFVSRASEGRRYRIFAYMGLGVFLFLFLKKGKVYYTAPVFLPLISAGSIYMEKFLNSRKKEILVGFLLMFMFLTALPFSLPLLSFKSYKAAAKKFLPAETHTDYGVMSDFEDRLGWEEMARAVSATYQNLPDKEKSSAYVFCASYGIAGALEYYSDRYEIPSVISANNNFMLWYNGGCNGEVVIMVGWEYRLLKKIFAQVQMVSQPGGHVRGKQIYLCKKILGDFNTVFSRLRHIGVY